VDIRNGFFFFLVDTPLLGGNDASVCSPAFSGLFWESVGEKIVCFCTVTSNSEVQSKFKPSRVQRRVLCSLLMLKALETKSCHIIRWSFSVIEDCHGVWQIVGSDPSSSAIVLPAWCVIACLCEAFLLFLSVCYAALDNSCPPSFQNS